jgi:hypothetical protein
MVAVAVPVAGAHMHLHVAGPQVIAYPDFCVEEVGAGIGVVSAGVDDGDPSSVHGDHIVMSDKTILPHIVH